MTHLNGTNAGSDGALVCHCGLDNQLSSLQVDILGQSNILGKRHHEKNTHFGKAVMMNTKDNQVEISIKVFISFFFFYFSKQSIR